jgi:hypothetical protein
VLTEARTPLTSDAGFEGPGCPMSCPVGACELVSGIGNERRAGMVNAVLRPITNTRCATPSYRRRGSRISGGGAFGQVSARRKSQPILTEDRRARG